MHIYTTVLLALALGVSHASATDPIDSSTAFQLLKKLNGVWEGTVESPSGPKTQVNYRLTANGNTLIETLFPGTSHEMISMYHRDGSDLVLTHYCAMGNQPKMRLTKANVKELIFDFAGGSNFDPKKDMHIHSGKIVFKDNDTIEAEWAVFNGEKPAGSNKFFLTRKKS